MSEWVQAGIGVGQLVMIGWGFWQIKQASGERNRQLDDQHTALMELLKRTGQ